ncbi:hypothetical protein CHE86_09380 [Salmonella enterica]|nr:hypothetical protein CHE86_09380 [Salmonella enterica]
MKDLHQTELANSDMSGFSRISHICNATLPQHFKTLQEFITLFILPKMENIFLNRYYLFIDGNIFMNPFHLAKILE